MTRQSWEPAVAVPSPAATAALLRARRSINAFHPQPPPRERILEALEVARWAPNHHLSEPWRFYLLGEETKQRVVALNAELVAARQGGRAAGIKRRRWAAVPGWLVVTCKRTADERQAWEDYAACACAIENLMLYLRSHDIGTKWTTGAVIEERRFYELLRIDARNERVVGMVWYGHPAETPHSRRLPVERTLVELP